MFAKLLKYEFRGSKSILTILSVVVLGVFLLATVAVKAIGLGVQSDSDDLIGIAVAAGLPVLFMAIFAIAAYAVAVEILLVVQFYKTKFTDEGYLTFTLPTNVHKIYQASLLNMMIWQVIMFVTLIIGIVIFALFGTDPDHFINTKVFTSEALREIMYAISMEFGWNAFDAVVLVLRLILNMLATAVLYTSCITLGATLSRKYKVLVSVGIYFAATSVVSVITSIISFTTTIGATALDTSVATLMDISGALETGLNLIIIVGGYILSTRMMKKKLNLA